jgi:hypothetical protein
VYLEKYPLQKRAGGGAQVVKHLPSKPQCRQK